MAQIARPISTVSGGTWDSAPASGQGKHLQIDEVSPSDSDYIYSNTVSQNTHTTAVEIGMGALTDPNNDTGHIIRARMRCGGTVTAAVSLMVGTTLYELITQALTTSYQLYSFTLTHGNGHISNYSDLRLRFSGQGGNGFTNFMEVSWAELEVPDVAVFVPRRTQRTPRTAAIRAAVR